MSSNKRVYLSGAQKNKVQADENCKKLKKISSFLDSSPKCVSKKSTSQYSETCDNTKESTSTFEQSIIRNEQIGNASFEQTVDRTDVCEMGKAIESAEREKEKVITDELQGGSTDVHTIANITKQTYPTDKGHFKDIRVLSTDIKKFIVSSGSCRPPGPYPLNSETQSRFSGYYYTTTNKAGVTIPRSWICYSKILDCAYCEPCWLFAERNNPHFNPAWINGIRAWKRLGDKIKDHENSAIHHKSCVVYEQWRQNKTIDKDYEARILKEKSFWCKVIHRIMNITLTLATCNLPFRGHREVIGGEIGSNGNFLSIVELLAMYDPVLKELISKPTGSIRYLSSTIQNEIIDLLSKTVIDKIVGDLKEAPFYAIIMDTTQDISKVDQMSKVFRYVKIEKDENDKPTEIKIKESFLGFTKIDDQTADGLVQEIIDSIKSVGLDLLKCRGQGYDGAAVMSGAYSGVQKQIIAKQENALYVHCCAHNLNLVLNDAMNGIPEVTRFFKTVERIYTFFGNSIKRWALLSTFFDSNEKKSNLKLKRLCPTRWSSRNDSLLAIRFRYLHIMQALAKIMLISTLSSEREEAYLLKKELETFEFVFHVVLHSKILITTNYVSTSLQKTDLDLSQAYSLIKEAYKELTNFRDHYEDAKKNAAEMSSIWKVEIVFDNKRIKKTKRHFDELCEDERLTDGESRFRANVFYGCLDIVINKLHERFQSLKYVNTVFQAIQRKN